MTTDMRKFFEAMNWRFGSENDLSDITYVMCESNPVFRQFFFDFFFKSHGLAADQFDFRREVVFNDGRPDFVMTNKSGDEVFFVEVKIGDWHHHFQQYEAILEKWMKQKYKVENYDVRSHIGYIANYEINERNVEESRGFSNIHTWEEFYSNLRRYQWFGDDAIQGYGEFVRQVCNFAILEDSELRREDFISAFTLYRRIYSVLEDEQHAKKIKIYPRGKTDDAYTKMGYNFSFAWRNKQTVYGWIGVWFSGDKDEFVVGFRDCDGWGSLVCDDFGRRGAYVDKRVVWDSSGWLWFYMNGEISESNIKIFLEETISKVREGISGLHENALDLADSKYCTMIRKLTSVIDKRFYFDFTSKDSARTFTVEYANEGFDPWSYCGRGVTLNVGSTKIDGWVGFDYTEDSTHGFKIQLNRRVGKLIELSRSWKESKDGKWVEKIMEDNAGHPVSSTTINQFTKWYRDEMHKLALKIR